MIKGQRVHVTSAGHSTSLDLRDGNIGGSVTTRSVASDVSRGSADLHGVGRQPIAEPAASVATAIQQRPSCNADNGVVPVDGGLTGNQRQQPSNSVERQSSVVGELRNQSSAMRQHPPPHHLQQHQQQMASPAEMYPQLHSRRKSEAMTSSSTWFKSFPRGRRRWSELIAVPDTPPSSPAATHDWVSPRFTAQLMYDARSKCSETSSESNETSSLHVDSSNQSQVRLG